MTQVKKAFQPIVDLMEQAVAENPKAKVSDILNQVIALTAAAVSRGVGSTFIKNKAGETIAIYDYYFKRWMPLVGEKAVEFGAKAKTATGFNSMCKEGVSHWTKQQREAKNAEQAILDEVAAGNLAIDQIASKRAEIEAARKAIVPTEHGFATLEEVGAYLTANGQDFDMPESTDLSAAA